MAVLLNGGDDAFSVGSPAAVDTVIDRWLSIDMGDGNDDGPARPGRQSARRRRASRHAAAHGHERPRRSRRRRRPPGAGATPKSAWHLNVAAGDGNDEVALCHGVHARRRAKSSCSPSWSAATGNISLGGGEDELEIQNADLARAPEHSGRRGPAHLDIDNVSIGKKLDIDTGSSDDQIAINLVRPAT